MINTLLLEVFLAQNTDEREELVDLAQIQHRAVVELDQAGALTVECVHFGFIHHTVTK